MYWRNNNGGWNKTHGQVEKTPRIDSYEAAAVQGWGTLFGYADDGISMAFDCCRYTLYGLEADREIVEVWHPKEGRGRELELARKNNGFGGDQAFFLCPACGQRVRYLYQVGAGFLCRKCAQVNYRSQQETRSDSMYYYHKGLDLVDKHLDTWPCVRPDGLTFCDWVPEKPRYMHRTTYCRILRRYLRYRQRHETRQLDELRRILGPCEWAKVLQIQNDD